MRIRALILVGAMASLTTNCTSKQEPASVPQLLLQAHFAGANQVASSPEGTKLKAIAGLPETRALLDQVLSRLSQSPAVLSAGTLSSNAVHSTEPVLRALFEDLWRNEFALTLQRIDRQPLDYTLAVRLSPDRKLAWRTNLVTLAGRWELGDIRQGTAGGLPTMEIGATNAPIRLRWVEAGEWGLLGVGTPSLPGLAAGLRAIGQGQPPVGTLGEAWLELTADLQSLAPLLNINTSLPWPRLELTMKGDGENLRSFGTLHFPRDITGPLEPWQVPTDIISEPLISFGAARGVAPLIAESGWLQAMGFGAAPNRCFTWAQQSVVGQMFLAFPMPGLTNQLPQVAKTFADRLPRLLQGAKPPTIHYSATNHAITLHDILPVVVPVLQSVQTAEGEYAMASLFPATRVAPPPQALLDQLNLTNLVFYSWEVTQPLLDQSLGLSQLASVVTQTPQLSTRQPTIPWLKTAATHLGNSATEVLATSPREWSFNRKSQVGFTAQELVLLARWINSVDFPNPGIRLPPEAAGQRRPGGAGAPR